LLHLSLGGPMRLAALGGLVAAQPGTCPATGCGGLQGAQAQMREELGWGDSTCLQAYHSLPTRTAFFHRVPRPSGMEQSQFEALLARGAIHPGGVVLASEFYELPIRVNASLLLEEASALQQEEEWESAAAANEEQGVVSKHFRLVHSEQPDLSGPFAAVGERLQRSPYTRSVLASLGGVVGNTAYMKVDPGGEVAAHFDTSPYWDARVRVHIPVQTNPNVTFSCGQLGEMHQLHMEAGKVYVFDNHLGHAVRNDGTEARIHLTVDLVGARRFWGLVGAARRVGSQPREATVGSMVPGSWNATVLVERWADQTARESCSAIATAFAATAPEDRRLEASRIGAEWCRAIGNANLSRSEEVSLLQTAAAAADCSAVSPISVTLKKADQKQRLGFSFSTVAGPGAATRMVVTEILPGGLLDDWNQRYPQQAVQVGGTIATVNGADTLDEMVGGLKSMAATLVVRPTWNPGLAEVADSVSAIHRLSEAKLEYSVVGVAHAKSA